MCLRRIYSEDVSRKRCYDTTVCRSRSVWVCALLMGDGVVLPYQQNKERSVLPTLVLYGSTSSVAKSATKFFESYGRWCDKVRLGVLKCAPSPWRTLKNRKSWNICYRSYQFRHTIRFGLICRVSTNSHFSPNGNYLKIDKTPATVRMLRARLI